MPIPREIKVGAFVGTGLVVAGLVVFLIGDERRAFESKERYYTVFDDVQGLTRGSPVRMGGVDVGSVASVAYSEDAKDSRLHIALDIVKVEARRIRADSVATIGNKGLLGDKMIVITVGSASSPEVPPGTTLKSQPPSDLSQIADRLGAMSEKAEAVIDNLKTTTDTFAEPGMQADLRSSVHSLSNILEKVDHGDGYVAKLLKDPTESEKMSRSLANLERASAELDTTLAGLNSAIARVNQGPGFAHDVIYGEGPTDAIAQFGRASGELATTLEGIRKGNGLAHSILYGDDATQQLIGDLNSITHDVKQIVEGVKAGKGTVGALMVDPSVYEDIKMLLGNVERNKTLRALVRYSIERDHRPPTVEVKDPEKAEGSAEAATEASGKLGRVGSGE